jgi:hypothetical protein
MRNIVRKNFFLFLLILLLIGTAAGGEDHERERLLQQQKVLTGRIETLKREQEFLLFQKTRYTSDSKYLIINLRSKTGQLRYKNRVIRDFPVTAAKTPGRIGEGAAVLTKKIEGSTRPNALVFGKACILQRKGGVSSQPGTNIPRISLGKKDFNALFYALEIGASVYILP